MWLKCDRRLVCEKYKRPAIWWGNLFEISGARWTVWRLASSSRAMCCRLDKCLPMWRACEWVLLQHVYMRRDEEAADGGKEDADGLIKCYSVLLWYSHHLTHRSGCAATACSPHRKANCPLSVCWLAKLGHRHTLDGKSLRPNPDPIFDSKSEVAKWVGAHLKGQGNGSQDAGRVRTQPVTATHIS